MMKRAETSLNTILLSFFLLIIGQTPPASGQPATKPDVDPVRRDIARLVQGPPALLNAAIAQGATAVITLQPVPPKTQPPSSYLGNSTIVGQRLQLNSIPARVWFEIHVTGWAPENLRIAQVTLDSNGYVGSSAICDGKPGEGGDLFPATASCSSSVECRALVSGVTCGQEASRCVARPPYYPPGSNICEPGFQDICDPEYLLSEADGNEAVAYALDLNFRYGAAADTGLVATDFAPSYLGTLVLDVPTTARGLYTIGFNPLSSWTRLEDDGEIPNLIPIAALVPAELEIPCGEGDCDIDGIPNEEEIDPAQQDCDNNGLCNGLEIDQCPGGEPACADCNGNRIPDSCEEDCNLNQVADSCDLADCPPGVPSCADCNGNAIPDNCDIASGHSLDVDLDEVPDECVPFTPNCTTKGQENHWTCPENWPLGGLYPDDDDSATGYAVTLPPTADVLLDQTVTIPALTLEPGSQLEMTQTGAEGDLQISETSPGEPGTLTIGGTLLVGDDRTIGPAPGAPDPDVIIEAGGLYASATPTEETNATLTCGNLLVTGVECSVEPCLDSGQIDLTEGMAVIVSGDVIVDGRSDFGECDHGHARGQLRDGEHIADTIAAASFHTPPSIRLAGNATLDIDSSLVLMGAAQFVVASTEPVMLAGDWENLLTGAECFDCAAGALALDGGDLQFFEAAATDVGPVGSVIDADYLIGDLEIVADSQILVRDLFDNDGLGQSPCSEAIYVNVLTLAAGSVITVDNCRVYYQTLNLDSSATVSLVGCGELMSVALPAAPTGDPTDYSKSRAISFVVPSETAAGGLGESAFRVRLVSLHHVQPPYTAGPSIPFVASEGEYRWVGPPETFFESATSGNPFQASRLQCAPYYHDWGSVGLLHTFGSAVVPSSLYEVQRLAASCQGIENRCTAISETILVPTTRWGDVETPFNPPSSTTQPDLGDVSALVNKFRGAPGAPIKARALLVGTDQIGTIDIAAEFSFTHIAVCIDAFRGRNYPHTIEDCP